MNNSQKLLAVFMTIIMLTLSTLRPLAYAGMVNTQTLLTTEQRTNVLQLTQRFLLEESVGEILVDYGVDQQAVIQRLSSLSDDELIMLSKEIEQAPAGAGALEVIGVVFLVLLLLELVGVTDIFKKL